MEDLIAKYLQGEAGEEEKKQILIWLQEDDEHKKQLVELRDVWLAAGNVPVFGPNSKQRAFKRFERNVSAYEKQKRHTISVRWMRIAAAVVLLAITLGGGYYAGMNHILDEQQFAEVIQTRFVMGKDSKGSVTLPDGTIAWLHADSKLTYPENFTGKERKVKLEGEGYFEVMKNEKKPFVVESNQMEITVLGTRFNVKNYDYQQNIETTLLSGRIQIYLPSIDRRVIMEPDQRIKWNRETGEYKLTRVEAENYINWINDKMVFNKHKLSDVIFHLERWYNIEIICDEKVDMNQRLTLTVRRELKDEIFKLLGLITSVTYKIDGDKVYISPRNNKTS